MATIRGKRPIPLFRLIKANPPGRYRTKKIACRLSIPRGRFETVRDYISEFSRRNNLHYSHFIVQNELVIA